MLPVRLPSSAAAIAVICPTSSATITRLTLPKASVCSACGSARNADPEARSSVFSKRARGPVAAGHDLGPVLDELLERGADRGDAARSEQRPRRRLGEQPGDLRDE